MVSSQSSRDIEGINSLRVGKLSVKGQIVNYFRFRRWHMLCIAVAAATPFSH